MENIIRSIQGMLESEYEGGTIDIVITKSGEINFVFNDDECKKRDVEVYVFCSSISLVISYLRSIDDKLGTYFFYIGSMDLFNGKMAYSTRIDYNGHTKESFLKKINKGGYTVDDIFLH